MTLFEVWGGLDFIYYIQAGHRAEMINKRSDSYLLNDTGEPGDLKTHQLERLMQCPGWTGEAGPAQ